MKTIKIIIILLIFSSIIQAQIPKTFNYQAVARNEAGNSIADQDIVVEISVRSGSASGTAIWQEVHYTKTNAFGLFTVEIGGSTAIRTETGTVSSFEAIDWSDNTYFIQTRVDFGQAEFVNGFIDMGTVKLTSVPYAFVADSALKVPIPSLSKVLGVDEASLNANDVPKWNGTQWTVGSAGVSGNFLTDDGTTDLTGDWTVSGNSINLTSGNLSLGSGILSTPIFNFGGTTFTSVSSNLSTNSSATALVTASAIKTYVDNNIGVSYWSLGSGNVYNTANYIGVGTASPTERLHVNLTSEETVLFTGTYEVTGNIKNRGAGTRFEFSPAKAVLRAGTVDGTQWDDINAGFYSVAFGKNNRASANFSFAQGEGNTVGGTYASAFGNSNVANGAKSMAIGESNVTSGASSFAANQQNTANGGYATALGYNTEANGDQSLSLGLNTTTDATADGSIAAGSGSTTYGPNSFAFGVQSQTNTSAEGSFASGNKTIGGGMYAASFGDNTAAYGYSEFAIGRFNTLFSQNLTSWVLTDRVFVVGIGADAISRANAMVVLKNGNIGIGIDAPTEKLAVSGNITATGSINSSSDIRYKKNISTIANPLEKINKLQGVNYMWKAEEFPELNFSENPQIGLIAQDVEKIVPEIVLTDGNGYKSVDYAKLSAILIEAIKEQQKQIDELKKNQEILLNQLKK